MRRGLPGRSRALLRPRGLRRLGGLVALAVGLALGTAACEDGGARRVVPDVQEVQDQLSQLRLEVQTLREEVRTLRQAVAPTETTAPAPTSSP